MLGSDKMNYKIRQEALICHGGYGYTPNYSNFNNNNNHQNNDRKNLEKPENNQNNNNPGYHVYFDKTPQNDIPKNQYQKIAQRPTNLRMYDHFEKNTS